MVADALGRQDEYDAGHIPGAIYPEIESIEGRLQLTSDLDRDPGFNAEVEQIQAPAQKLRTWERPTSTNSRGINTWSERS